MCDKHEGFLRNVGLPSVDLSSCFRRMVSSLRPERWRLHCDEAHNRLKFGVGEGRAGRPSRPSGASGSRVSTSNDSAVGSSGAGSLDLDERTGYMVGGLPVGQLFASSR